MRICAHAAHRAHANQLRVRKALRTHGNVARAKLRARKRERWEHRAVAGAQGSGAGSNRSVCYRGSLTGLEPGSEEAVVREGILPTDWGGMNRTQILGAQRLGTGRWFPVRIAGTFRGRFGRAAAGGIRVIFRRAAAR